MALSHGAFVKLVALNNDRPKISWSSEKKADGLITVILIGTALTERETSVFMTEMADYVGGMSQLKIEKVGQSPDQAALPAQALPHDDAEKRAALHALLDTPIQKFQWVANPRASGGIQKRIVTYVEADLRRSQQYSEPPLNDVVPTIGRLVLCTEREVLRMNMVGETQVTAIKDKLAELGLRLGMARAELDGWVPLEERNIAQAQPEG
jgi:hypothetical protein